MTRSLRTRGMPLVRALAGWLGRLRARPAFPGSARYWEERYRSGGDSGTGSAGRLAAFKAGFLNDFVERHGVRSVIEHGCGDGRQLALAQYPAYLGLDVSPAALARCASRFGSAGTRRFCLVSEYRGETADLALSLDVIFHLVEDEVYEGYMRRLFCSAERFVIVYSSDGPPVPGATGAHVRHRNFTAWVEREAPEWTLEQRVPNPHPYRSDEEEGSFSDFFVYRRTR